MKKLIIILNQIINYFYYLKSSITKNGYPCKLVGEKILPPDNEQIIIFKALGRTGLYYVPLSNIFIDKNLIACFSPKDALQLGKIAFHKVILSLPINEQLNRFKKIKEIMLSSTHDVYPISSASNVYSILSDIEKGNSLEIDFSFTIQENKYPFKLVGFESNNRLDNTIIIYTILGRRDGHKKSLQNILKHKFIEKFHPTEAIKFGFIYTGDEFFTKNLDEKRAKNNDSN